MGILSGCSGGSALGARMGILSGCSGGSALGARMGCQNGHSESLLWSDIGVGLQWI